MRCGTVLFEVFLSLCCFFEIKTHTQRPDFQISYTPRWQTILDADYNSAFFAEIWVEIGTLEIRKRAAYEASINHLELEWTGESLPKNVQISLYRQDQHFDRCNPIESNLVCDGQWHPSSKRVIFNFKHHEALGHRSIFHLVLTIHPEDLKSYTKHAKFKLKEEGLPYYLQKALTSNPVYLTIAPTKGNKDV